MLFDKGLAANKKSSRGNKSRGSLSSPLDTAPLAVRVTDIILNSDYPNIEDYGGLNSIGTIFYELVTTTSPGRGSARPLFPQLSAYPLPNEIVWVISLPSSDMGVSSLTSTAKYYINTISLWNHPHHNAYPNPITSATIPESQQKDYQQVEVGSPRRVTDESPEISLNSPINSSQATFIERTNIHPLLPFAGDVIYQGRWGNSIRLGSTAKPSGEEAINDWSEVGENGDPITIIRNGQPLLSSDEGWVPITEDVNDDLSSIYQTSTQKIPIETTNTEFTSYPEPPESPNLYTSPQVIINSDRLVFNAKKDHVLISGEKSIFLGANSSLNFNAGNNVVVECGDIKLGGKNANESVIKGDLFLSELLQIMTALNTLATTLGTDTIWPVGAPAPNAAVNAAALTLTNLIPQFNGKIESYKSSITKTL